MKMASVGNENFAAPMEQRSEVSFNKDFKLIATLYTGSFFSKKYHSGCNWSQVAAATKRGLRS